MGEAIDEMKKHVLISSREDMAYRVSFDAPGRELAQRVLELAGQRRGRRRCAAPGPRGRGDQALPGRRAQARRRRPEDQGERARRVPGRAPGLRARGGGHGGVGRRRDPRARAHTRRAGVVLGRGRATGAAGGADRGGAGRRRRARRCHRAGRRDPPLVAARERARAELQPAQRALTEKQAMFTNEHPDVKAAHPPRRGRRGGVPSRRGSGRGRPRRARGRAAPRRAGAGEEGQDTARTAALQARAGGRPLADRRRSRAARCVVETQCRPRVQLAGRHRHRVDAPESRRRRGARASGAAARASSSRPSSWRRWPAAGRAGAWS